MANSMGRRSMSGTPERLHLGCNPLMQCGIDNCVYVLANIMTVHNEFRAAHHQFILWIPYRKAGLVRRELTTGWSIPL